MGLVRQMEDLQIVFTSRDELTENTLTAEDISEVRINEQDLVGGRAKIRIRNKAGSNKSKFYEGYKVDVKIQWVGGSLTSFWLGRITKKLPANDLYQRQCITLDAVDEGTWTLSGINTTTYHTHASVDVGVIVKALLDTYTTFDTANINQTTGTTISISIQTGRNIMDIIRELISGTNNSFYIDETGHAYLIERGASSSYTLGELSGRTFDVDRDIYSIKNDILVKGSYIADATSTSQEGPPDGYWNIDNSTYRRKIKFTPTGTMIQAAIMAYNSAASDHNLMIRIQPDNGAGTGPVDIANYSADIATVFVPNSVINTEEAEAVGGDINANLIDGVVDYWIIVESDSATGNLLTVGYKTVSAVNTLIYEVYTREELINTPGTGTDAESIAKHGTRAYTHIDRTLSSQDEVDEKAAALLIEYKDLANTVKGELLTDIFTGAHARVGQGVTVNLPDEEVDGNVLGIIGIVWSIRTENGTYLDIPNLILSDTPPPLDDADWAAQIGRQMDSISNSVSVIQATSRSIPMHAIGGTRHSPSTLAALNALISDNDLVGDDDARLSDARTPLAHDHEGVDIKSTGETGTAKFLRVDGDDTCSWQPIPAADPPEGTAVKSTGETGTSKFLRIDGDDTCSWQEPSSLDTTAIHKATDGEIAAMDDKTPPVDADMLVIEDSEASDAKKKLTLANLKAYIGGGASGEEVVITCYNDTGDQIIKGSICYVSDDNGGTPMIALAKADAVATTRGMLVMPKDDIDDEGTGECVVIGPVDEFSELTTGMPVYISEASAGVITQTIPSTAGHYVRIAGYALSATVVYFLPDGTYIKRR